MPVPSPHAVRQVYTLSISSRHAAAAADFDLAMFYASATVTCGISFWFVLAGVFARRSGIHISADKNADGTRHHPPRPGPCRHACPCSVCLFTPLLTPQASSTRKS